MIVARRIIRHPVPGNTVEPIPDQAIIVEGDLDYIDDGSAELPDHVVYIATMDESGVITEVLDNATPDDATHTFAGWPLPDGMLP